ncbi:MAG: chemotaxis protein CheX [Candidatus Solibacter sp.]|nr:chemotaxis protein CheX [Candidatus Solibacter sp.]
MIDTTIRTALSSAVADVLESMFFLEGLSEAAEPPPDAETVTVHLTFTGNPPGCFQMRLACPAALTIAADFLGEDAESLTAQQSTDVTLELANMICGAVLSRTESSASFRLDTPQIVPQGTGQHVPDEKTRYTVETGSGTLTVAIQMETPICLPTERYAS